MSDIAERLRQHIGLDQLDEDDQVALVPRWEVEEAAAEIERLRRYEQGYEQCRATLKNVADDRNEMQGMIERLRDEVDTLKARIEFHTSCITVYRDEAMLGWEKVSRAAKRRRLE